MKRFLTAKLTLALIGASCVATVGDENASDPGFKFTNKTGAKEGGQVLSSAIARDRSLVFNAAEIALIKVFDATAKPMRRNAGKVGTEPGAFSRAPLEGKAGGILMFGPYAPLEPGRHLVVYRFQFWEEIKKKDNACFLDVSSGTVTFSGRRPAAVDVPSGTWQEIAVPVDVPKKMNFEYRFWAHKQAVAIDRIYVYRMKERSPETAPISVMGGVKRPGSFAVPKDGASAKVLVDLAGGRKAHVPKDFFGGVWRPVDGVYRRVFQQEENAEMPLLPGDILWVSKRANAGKK